MICSYSYSCLKIISETQTAVYSYGKRFLSYPARSELFEARSLCLLYTAVDGVVQCFDGGIQSVQKGFVAQFGLAAALNPVKVCPEKLDFLFGITLFDALERFSCIH